MDILDTINLIGILAAIKLIVGILANVDRAWKNVCKGWALLRPRLLNAKRALVTSLREMVGEDERQEDDHSPPEIVYKHTSDNLSVGLTEGRLLITPPPLCVNVFN